MTWRAAKSLIVLRDQANALWPDRSTASDGLIGDAAHAATASDHNPNPAGVVCAFDLTHDAAAGCNGDAIAESIRRNPHPDVKYVIWNHRIYSAYQHGSDAPFTWRPYSGDPHTNHVHISVGVGRDGQSTPPYDDETPPWNLISAQEVPATPIPLPQETDEMFIITRPGVSILVANGKMTYLTARALYTFVAKSVIVIDLTKDDADDQKQMASFQHQYGEPA